MLEDRVRKNLSKRHVFKTRDGRKDGEEKNLLSQRVTNTSSSTPLFPPVKVPGYGLEVFPQSSLGAQLVEQWLPMTDGGEGAHVRSSREDRRELRGKHPPASHQFLLQVSTCPLTHLTGLIKKSIRLMSLCLSSNVQSQQSKLSSFWRQMGRKPRAPRILHSGMLVTELGTGRKQQLVLNTMPWLLGNWFSCLHCHTCHQLVNFYGSLQFDSLQLILQDQLIWLVDVLGAGRLWRQIVLWRQGNTKLWEGDSSYTASELIWQLCQLDPSPCPPQHFCPLPDSKLPVACSANLNAYVRIPLWWNIALATKEAKKLTCEGTFIKNRLHIQAGSGRGWSICWL